MSYRQPFTGEWPITQYFGETITDPKGHTGIDYGCPLGTPILASADGAVSYTQISNVGYGNDVMLLHPDGNYTLYAHLGQILVKRWQKVKQGDVIGYSGSTGNSTGPHLHFEVRGSDGKAFDPLTLPLMSVDDSIGQQPAADQKTDHPEIHAGTVRVICEWPANVRNTYNHAIVNGQKHNGDTFRITDGTLQINGLPYHRIIPEYVDDLGGLIAEYDAYGTQILEQINV